jgi:hypothetical protein
MVLLPGQQATPDPILNKLHYFFEDIEIEHNKKCKCPRDMIKGKNRTDDVGQRDRESRAIQERQLRDNKACMSWTLNSAQTRKDSVVPDDEDALSLVTTKPVLIEGALVGLLPPLLLLLLLLGSGCTTAISSCAARHLLVGLGHLRPAKACLRLPEGLSTGAGSCPRIRL